MSVVNTQTYTDKVLDMLEVALTKSPVELDEADLITLSEAARITGRSMSTIGNMLDRHVLPWYERPENARLGSKRSERFTSRKAVARMGKKSRTGLPKPPT
jgi:hypothetical protein